MNLIALMIIVNQQWSLAKPQTKGDLNMASKKKRWTMPSEIHGGKPKPKPMTELAPAPVVTTTTAPKTPIKITVGGQTDAVFGFEDEQYQKFVNAVESFEEIPSNKIFDYLDELIDRGVSQDLQEMFLHNMGWVRCIVALKRGIFEEVPASLDIIERGADYFSDEDYEKTMSQIDEVRDFLESRGFDTLSKTSIKEAPTSVKLNVQAFQQLQLGNQGVALSLFKHSLQSARQENNSPMIVKTLTSVISLLITLEQREEAKSYLEEATKLAQTTNHPQLTASIKRWNLDLNTSFWT